MSQKMEVLKLFDLFVLVYILFVPLGSGNEFTTLLYVLPHDSPGLCPTTNMSHCQTLNSYVDNAASFFLSDTALLFLPGNHLLNQTVEFHDITNIGLLSYNTSYRQQNPTIMCSPPHLPGTSIDAGFYFSNITRMQIVNLSFSDCGHELHKHLRAISLHNITDLSLKYIEVRYSPGYGLHADNIFGQSQISHSAFSHSTQGGNALLNYKHCSYKDTIKKSVLTISSSFFGHGIGIPGYLASGISAFIWCTNVDVEIIDVVTINNTVYGHGAGGNIAVLLRNRTHLIKNKVVVKNCHIEAGYGHFGGGLFVSFEIVPLVLTNNTHTQELLIESTNFTRNHATGEGGGLYIITHEVIDLLHPVGLITITNCLFDSNTLDNELIAGVALHINNHYIPGYAEHIAPQYKLTVNHSQFTNNSVILNSDDHQKSTSSAMFILQTQSGVYVSDCIFDHNDVTGLTVGRSNVIFSGEIKFEGNSGFNGGGMLLCDRSFMFLTPYTRVSFIHNHAINTGGGIFVGEQCLQSIPNCFYQFSRSVLDDQKLLSTISVYSANNTAGSAGSAIYGGSVDFCVIMNPWMYTPSVIYGSAVFDEVFNTTHDIFDHSYVTSDPYEICFCSEPPYAQPNYTSTQIERVIYPGSTFTIWVVAIGQKNGTAPGSVRALAQHPTYLGTLQVSQDVKVNCTALNYTVYSPVSSTEIELQVEGPLLSAPPTLKIKKSSIKLMLKVCPIGFTLSNGMCACTAVLGGKEGVECVLDPFPAVRRSSYSWIGYHNSSDANRSGIIYHKYCPLDYCKTDLVYIRATDSSYNQDDQCAYSRTGLLCGKCPVGLSVVFGSSKCFACSDRFLSLIIVFAVAGIMLVAFLNISQLTVTNGAINGLIFYANIIQVNRSFLEAKIGLNPIFEVFIAWLNLDLGIELCFYNGMDMFAKVFLQFAFPAYVLFLAFLIIYLSRKSYKAARLMGRNAVQVLATLFILCYAKFLRIIISIFSATVIVYPDTSSEGMWTVDGNIPYAKGKHMALIIVGLLTTCFSLPYTFIVTFHQCIQKSNLTCCHWIHRMKPLLDAYGGTYKDKYRFWTGMLLFIRLFLFVIFALNVQQNPCINLMAILFVCLCVLSLGWVLGGVYRHWIPDVLEVSFFLNLAILSAGSLDALWKTDARSQKLFTSISVGLAFATFLFVLPFRFWKVALKIFTQIRSSSREENVLIEDIPPAISSTTSSVVDIKHLEKRNEHRDRECEPLLS